MYLVTINALSDYIELDSQSDRTGTRASQTALQMCFSLPAAVIILGLLVTAEEGTPDSVMSVQKNSTEALSSSSNVAS